MPYAKPWESHTELLALLKQRGLAVSNDAKALGYLQRIGYYRLSGYWFDFRVRTEVCCPLERPAGRRKFKKGDTDKLVLDDFKAGANFEQAVNLYVFDKKLRLLVMDALERIEIALRADIAHLLGEKDAFAYLKPELFFSGFSSDIDPKTGLTKHHAWLAKQAGLISRSREKFIEHNKQKHGLPLPIWIACEVWDFGAMSSLFAGMQPADQDAIAAKYGLNNGRILASWLRSLNYLRNVCAHHNRLWNRNIVDQPKLPSSTQVPWVSHFERDNHAKARPFMLFCIANQLLGCINPTSSWWARLTSLLEEEFPDMSNIGVTLRGMGVVEGWRKLCELPR